MAVHVLLSVIGLGLLAAAADQLVLGASRLATRLRVSPVVVGVVVIGLGTSAPELLVSGLAATRGDAGIAVGNLVGSNILNITLILGIAALVAPISVRSTVVRREIPLAVAGMLLFALAALAGLGRGSGSVLLLAQAGALALLLRWARDPGDPRLDAQVVAFAEEGPAHRTGTEALRALAGLVGVLTGAQLLVDNAATIATRLGVSPVVIGFTLVAVGTSLPELVTTVQAQRRGETDLGIGNLFGSNLFNSLAGGGIVGLAGGGSERLTAGLGAAMMCAGLLAWALLGRGLRLTRTESALLLLAYALTLPLLPG